MTFNVEITTVGGDVLTDNGFDVYVVDCSAGSVTVTLATDYDGKIYIIKRRPTGVGTSNILTVVTQDSSSIDNLSSVNLLEGELLKIIKFSGNWLTFI